MAQRDTSFISSLQNGQIIEPMSGGEYENRIRFALEIVRRTRAAVGKNFIIIRLSMLDLVEGEVIGMKLFTWLRRLSPLAYPLSTRASADMKHGFRPLRPWCPEPVLLG